MERRATEKLFKKSLLSEILELLASKEELFKVKEGTIMSSYENVVGGKLKLKGKALDVKAGGMKKKKKKHNTGNLSHQITPTETSQGGAIIEADEEDTIDGDKCGEGGNSSSYVDSLTPAERRYMEQRQRIDVQKLAKTANKSHRDRISDFNQYLANMSEHYDIPKVGPG